MKFTCPLGAKCEVVDDNGNVEERCRWYVSVMGQNPQTGDKVDQWGCAITFMPVLQIESSQQTRHVAKGVEELRNFVADPPEVELLSQFGTPARIK